MKEIRLEFDPELLESLNGFIQLMAKILSNKLIVDLDASKEIVQDEDLYDGWKAGLLDDLQTDCQEFQRLLASGDIKDGSILLNLESAEAILRACSAIRAQIQQTLLEDIDTEMIENGEMDVDSINDHQQKGYAVYLFLAGLQELLLAELDPEFFEI